MHQKLTHIAACLIVPVWLGSAFAQGSNPVDSNETYRFGYGEYRLGPEDVITVFVWKEPELTTTLAVLPDGRVSLPLAGEFTAAGRTTAELEAEIQGKLRKYVSNALVNVSVKEVNNPKISVVGKVRRPDVYRMKQRTSILDAIAMAGGLTEFAGNRVTVIRNGSQGVRRYAVDFRNLVKDGGPIHYLEPADTVYVE